MLLAEQFKACRCNFRVALRWKCQFSLVFPMREGVVADADADPCGSQLILPELQPNFLRKLHENMAHFIFREQVIRAGNAVTNAFDGRIIVAGHHAGLIKSIGEDPQFLAVDSEQSDKHLTICFGQISDGVDPVAPQPFCGGSSNTEKFRRWQGPDLLLEGRFRDFCYGIRFLHIGSQLGENLIEADPDRYGKPYFFLYCLSDLVGYLGRCLMCQKGRAGELDPTLIDAEGLHFRGIPQIDCTHNPGKLQVLIHVRRDDR